MPGEKRPLSKGWQAEASNDPAIVAAMWHDNPTANVGLAIQPGFLVLDADVYKADRQAAFDAYQDEHGTLPNTLEFASARGGLHLIYQADKIVGNSPGSLADWCDVRGHGGLIVGPGSWFEGKRYTVERVGQPAPLPQHIASRLVARQRTDSTRELPPGVELDDPANVARYVHWLEHDAETWGDGSGKGNNTLAATGAMGSSYGLSWDVTLECMGDHWNDRCEPPWEPEDLERHGGSGYRSAEHFGNCAEPNWSGIFKPVSANVERVAPAEIPGKLVMGAGMFDAIVNQPPDLVQDVAAAGELTVIAGDRGTGKSAILARLSHAVVTGTPFLGNKVAHAGKVLIIAAEGARRTIRDFQAVCLHEGQDPNAIANRGFAVYRGSTRVNKPDGALELDNLIHQFAAHFGSPPDLLAFDTVRKNMAGSVSRDDDVNGVFLAYEALWGAHPKIAVIAIAHTAKPTANGQMSTKGASDWEQGADIVLWIQGRVRDKQTTLTYEKLKSGEDGRSVGIDFVLNDAEGYRRTIVAVDGGSRTPPTPRQAAARDKEDSLTMSVIRKAAETYLAEVTGRWSQRGFADALWHHLGLQGHEIPQGTVRRYVQQGSMLPPTRMKEK